MSESLPPSGALGLSLLWVAGACCGCRGLCPRASLPGHCLGSPLAQAFHTGMGMPAELSATPLGTPPREPAPRTSNAMCCLTWVELMGCCPLPAPPHPGRRGLAMFSSIPPRLRTSAKASSSLYSLGSQAPRTTDQDISGFPTFFRHP